MSCHVQNFVVIGRVHFKPEHCKFWLNFELDRNFGIGTEAGWRINASVNWVIIGSDNGLLPVWCQAITWTNADHLSIGYFRNMTFIKHDVQKRVRAWLNLTVYLGNRCTLSLAPPPHPPTPPPPTQHTPSLTHSFTHSLTHQPTHSFTQQHTHPAIHLYYRSQIKKKKNLLIIKHMSRVSCQKGPTRHA